MKVSLAIEGFTTRKYCELVLKDMDKVLCDFITTKEQPMSTTISMSLSYCYYNLN
jgi:hypothetical protein